MPDLEKGGNKERVEEYDGQNEDREAFRNLKVHDSDSELSADSSDENSGDDSDSESDEGPGICCRYGSGFDQRVQCAADTVFSNTHVQVFFKEGLHMRPEGDFTSPKEPEGPMGDAAVWGTRAHMKWVQSQRPDCPVHLLQPKEQNEFLSHLFGCLFLQIALTVISVYGLTQTGDFGHYAEHHVWVYYVLLTCVMIIFFLYFCWSTRDSAFGFQVLWLIFNTLVMIAVLSLLVGQSDSFLGLQAFMIFGFFTLIFFVYTYFTARKFSFIGATLFVLFGGGLLVFFMIIYPHEDDVSKDWVLNPPRETWHIFLIIAIGVGLTLYIMRDTYTRIRSYTRLDWLDCLNRTYIDITVFSVGSFALSRHLRSRSWADEQDNNPIVSYS